MRFPAKPGRRSTFSIFAEPERGDVTVGEISLIVEGAGIAKIARESQLGGEAKAVAVVEDWHGRGRVRCSRIGVFFESRIVRARGIDAQSDPGVNWFRFARRRLDLFRFDVDGLSDFVETAVLQAAVACDVGDDLEFLTVCVGIDGCVETWRGFSQLNVESASEEKC